MKLRVFGTFLCSMLLLDAAYESTINNTNFLLSTGSTLSGDTQRYSYDYNRLRYRGDYTHKDYFTTVIADFVNYVGTSYVNSATFAQLQTLTSDTPFETASSYSNYSDGSSYSKLYRLYTGYEDDQKRIVVGLQNINMGVGRIWVPNNLFNPKNSFALEPDEVFGVAAINYVKHLSETSEFNIVASQKRDERYKYLLRYKTLVKTTEIALNAIASDDTKMLGLEVEGDVGESGVELRAEAVYLEATLKDTLLTTKEYYFTQGIIGADYGFSNGITLAVEAFYSSQTFSRNEIAYNLLSDTPSSLVFSHFYLGSTLSYSVNLYLDAGITYIESFNDQNSHFIAPALTYTLNDYNSFSLGALILQGSDSSEFGSFENSYYLKYGLSF